MSHERNEIKPGTIFNDNVRTIREHVQEFQKKLNKPKPRCRIYFGFPSKKHYNGAVLMVDNGRIAKTVIGDVNYYLGKKVAEESESYFVILLYPYIQPG